MLGPLLVIGYISGFTIAALGHPKIYRLFFGGKERSLDHN